MQFAENTSVRMKSVTASPKSNLPPYVSCLKMRTGAKKRERRRKRKRYEREEEPKLAALVQKWSCFLETELAAARRGSESDCVAIRITEAKTIPPHYWQIGQLGFWEMRGKGTQGVQLPWQSARFAALERVTTVLHAALERAKGTYGFNATDYCLVGRSFYHFRDATVEFPLRIQTWQQATVELQGSGT